MATKRVEDGVFIEGAISIVAKEGIENLRTRDVAQYAGFSEATLFKRYPTKENLLLNAFLYIDNKISGILLNDPYIMKPDDGFDKAIFHIWHKIYRYLIDNEDETLFLIRYRYSSLYTKEVRHMRKAYNGSFDEVYEIFENNIGGLPNSYKGFLINYIFELTLTFAEKVVTKKIRDIPEVEYSVRSAILAAVIEITSGQRKFGSDFIIGETEDDD